MKFQVRIMRLLALFGPFTDQNDRFPPRGPEANGDVPLDGVAFSRLDIRPNRRACSQANNGVSLSTELLEWGRKFSVFWG